MAGPLLLVHDDAETLAAIQKVLARQSHPVVVARTIAAARAALSSARPGLVLLANRVDGARGKQVLEALGKQPGAAVPVLLLGEAIAGVSHPVAPLPPNRDFLARVLELIQATEAAAAREILESAGRALGRARADASAAREELNREVEQLRRQTGEDAAQLGTERAAHSKLLAEHQEVTTRLARNEAALAASVASGKQLGEQLERLTQEHRAVTAQRDAVEQSLREEHERSRERAEVAAALELKRAERQEAARRSLQQAESAGQRTHRELAEVRAELETSRAEQARSRRQHEEDRASAGNTLEAERSGHGRTRSERDELLLRISRLEADAVIAARALESASAEHGRARAALDELTTRHAALDAQLSTTQHLLDQSGAELQSERSQRSAERDELLVRSSALEARLSSSEHQHEVDAVAAAAALKALSAEHSRTRDELTARHASLEGELTRNRQELELGRAALESERSARAEQQSRLETTGVALEAAAHALSSARSERATEQDRFEAERAELLSRVGNAEQLLATGRERAELAETRALQAEERARELESRAELKLTVEEAPVLIPRAGRLGLRTLASLVLQLTRGKADTRLELTSSRGTRLLWLEQGALVAAESSLASETFSNRARRDGLIDGPQETQLRALGALSPTQLLEELRLRGMVRRAEVPGLLRRSAEEIALEALGEPECSYQLFPEPAPPRLRLDGSSRPLTLLLALAFRRAFPWESHLELLGGTQTVPRRTGLLEPQAFGFSEPERRMLEAIDGETSVERLVVASHLRPDGAYRVLSAAKLLGLIELSERRAARPPPVPLLALLEAKYEQVQQADYFAILELPRTADAVQVQRAHQLLSRQFEPLRYAEDADPSTQHRARVVLTVMEEAARTLRDDRLRVAYARHLRD